MLADMVLLVHAALHLLDQRMRACSNPMVKRSRWQYILASRRTLACNLLPAGRSLISVSVTCTAFNHSLHQCTTERCSRTAAERGSPAASPYLCFPTAAHAPHCLQVQAQTPPAPRSPQRAAAPSCAAPPLQQPTSRQRCWLAHWTWRSWPGWAGSRRCAPTTARAGLCLQQTCCWCPTARCCSQRRGGHWASSWRAQW